MESVRHGKTIAAAIAAMVLAVATGCGQAPVTATAEPEPSITPDHQGGAADEARPRVRMADGNEIVVPLNLDFAVSENRKMLLQYGDSLMRMHPMRTDLFWIGNGGEITNRVQNRFAGGARLNLSEDGFTAVAAPEYFAARKAANAGGSPPSPIVDLYAPDGRRLFSTQLEKETIVHHLLALPRGRGVVVAVAPADAPLERNELRVLRDREPVVSTAREFGILQKVVLLSDNTTAFVQGSDFYGVVGLESGDERWRQPGQIRLISPYGAVLGPEGQRLYLMTGERVSSAALYQWTLSVLDAATGRTLRQTRLKGIYPGTPDRVFEAIEGDRVTVLTGAETLTLRIPLGD